MDCIAIGVAAANGGSGGGGSYDDTEIKKDIEQIETDILSVEKEIDDVKEDVRKLNDGGLNLKDEVIEADVKNWLSEHPEATTTVQDGALTEAKFSNALKLHTIKDYVTPQMFGAKCDGVTDDTDAFQQAIDTSVALKTLLFIPKGEYLLQNPVVVKTNTIIKGEGKAKTIISGTGEKIFTDNGVSCYRVEISDIGLKGTGDNIAISGAFPYSSFENLFITKVQTCIDLLYGTWIFCAKNIECNKAEYGIQLPNEGNNLSFDFVRMEDITESCIDTKGTVRSVAITNSSFERSHVGFTIRNSPKSFNVSTSYFEGLYHICVMERNNYIADVHFSKNYFHNPREKAGFMCLIYKVTSDNVQGGLVSFTNNSFTGISSEYKPFAFAVAVFDETLAEENYNKIDLKIVFRENYIEYSYYKSFIELFDRTNYPNFMKALSRRYVETDYPLVYSEDIPNIIFTTESSYKHMVQINNNNAPCYRIQGFYKISVTGKTSLGIVIPEEVQVYTGTNVQCTVLYNDETVQQTYCIISNKLEIRNLDANKTVAKIFFDGSYVAH